MKGLLKKRILMYRVNKRQEYPYKQLVEDQDTNIRLVEYNINEGLVEEIILMYSVNKRQEYSYKLLVENQDTNIWLVKYNINEGLVEEKNINVQGQ